MGLIVVRDVLVSSLQSPNKAHQVRNFKLTATDEAMLRQNVRQQCRQFMAVGQISKLEDIEVVCVNLSKLLLRLICQLEHPND